MSTRFAVQLTPSQVDALRALSKRVQPACRPNALSPAAEHLARRVGRSWPTNEAIEAARAEDGRRVAREEAGRPTPLALTDDAFASLGAAAELRHVSRGLLLRAALIAATR